MTSRPRSDLPLAALAAVQAFVLTRPAAARRGTTTSSPARARGDAGQTTAEYALVLLGAATLALLLLAWAAKTDRIGKLLDFVFEQITGRVR